MLLFGAIFNVTHELSRYSLAFTDIFADAVSVCEAAIATQSHSNIKKIIGSFRNIRICGGCVNER